MAIDGLKLTGMIGQQYTGHVSQQLSGCWQLLTELQALFGAQIFYVVALGLTRISTGIFTGRFLTRDQGNLRLAYGFTMAFVVWTVTSVFIVALRWPLAQPWETLDGSSTMVRLASLSFDRCSCH